MNHITYRNRLESLMLSYINFLPLCVTIADSFRLMDEIQGLRVKIGKIERMNVSDGADEVLFWIDTVESVGFALPSLSK